MFILKRWYVTARIKRAVTRTYEQDLSKSLLDTVEIFRLLDTESLFKVWSNPLADYTLYGDNLETISRKVDDTFLQIPPILPNDQKALAEPLEWLSGAKRDHIVGMLNNFRMPDLGEIAASVWYRLVRRDFTVLSVDQRDATLFALRRILKGIPECL